MELPEHPRVKCLKERDMMVSPMGAVLTSEAAQSARTEMSEAVEVSVVIPCLNEANSLAYCVDKAMKAFQAAGLCGEVVVADNGSTDGSIQIAKEHGARRCNRTKAPVKYGEERDMMLPPWERC